MADHFQRRGSVSTPTSGSSHTPHPAQHPLSCTHCRQRKVKCDKIHPCSPCARSGLNCVFPERVRHPKKKPSSSKATNDELMRRLGRMEELIEKMKVEGKDANGSNVVVEARICPSLKMPQLGRQMSEGSRLQDDGGSDILGNGTTRFIGSAFFRSLTNEVEGLKQTMDDVSDGEEHAPESSQTPSDTQSSHAPLLFGSSLLPSQELRLLHPIPHHMSILCSFYARNCDPMGKVLHIPSLRKLVASASADVQDIPFGNYVEALLFAIYYAAITSLTQEECLQCFQDGRKELLAEYRNGTEAALANADLLNTKDMRTLQALVIFLVSVRTNDDSQFAWTLFGIAARLGQSLGLHRENSRSGLSPFEIESRRRLWWQIIHLDVRCCEDRGSDPLILENSFNTKKPLNINDSDMDPESMEPLVERQEFTEMTKTWGSYLLWDTAVRVGFVAPIKEGEEDLPPKYSFEEKALMLSHLEKKLESKILIHCDPANPLAWVTSVVIRLITARLRLSLYHPPMHDSRSTSHQFVSRESVLEAGVQNLEYTHLLNTEPTVARWGWYFKTHVQWHALAATLAELCVQDKGPLVERAWKIVDVIFDDWAAWIADSMNGMLWRPIKKLMSKAQAKRNESRTRMTSITPQQQQPLPQFDSYNPLQDPSLANVQYHPDSVLGLSQTFHLDQGLPSDTMSSLNVNDSAGTINWAEWDEFMQDFEMAGSGAIDSNAIQQDASQLGAWW